MWVECEHTGKPCVVQSADSPQDLFHARAKATDTSRAVFLIEVAGQKIRYTSDVT